MTETATNVSASITIIAPTIIEDTRKFFISYKKDTALDLASHIHDGLHERGVEAFLDDIDIEKGLTKKEWQRQIDNAVRESQVFLLIITNGASSSSGVKREFSIAKRDKNKKIFAFIDNSIWNENGEVTMLLGRTTINLKAFQVSRFDAQNPPSLLREVCRSARVIKIFKAT